MIDGEETAAQCKHEDQHQQDQHSAFHGNESLTYLMTRTRLDAPSRVFWWVSYLGSGQPLTGQRLADAFQERLGHGIDRSLEDGHTKDVGIGLAHDREDLLHVIGDREASRSTLGYIFSGLDTV